MSKDKDDIHSQTAAQLFDETNRAARRRAKEINSGHIYMTNKIDLPALAKILNATEFVKKGQELTAELADENDPHGIVHIKQNGRVIMQIPRDVYEDMLEMDL